MNKTEPLQVEEHLAMKVTLQGYMSPYVIL